MDENTLLSLMAMLDAGSNMTGRPLKPDTRARLYAVIDAPDQDTWEDAHTIILCGFVTLWQAVLRHTAYDVTSKPDDEPWPAVPTREQIFAAIRLELLLQAS